MPKRKIAKNTALMPRHLDKLIEEAIVDCYDKEEQASGFFTMIEENLALPFATRVLGVEASVVAVEMDNDGSLAAVCERSGERQRCGPRQTHHRDQRLLDRPIKSGDDSSSATARLCSDERIANASANAFCAAKQRSPFALIPAGANSPRATANGWGSVQ
jgi:hypothetical protein